MDYILTSMLVNEGGAKMKVWSFEVGGPLWGS